MSGPFLGAQTFKSHLLITSILSFAGCNLHFLNSPGMWPGKWGPLRWDQWLVQSPWYFVVKDLAFTVHTLHISPWKNLWAQTDLISRYPLFSSHPITLRSPDQKTSQSHPHLPAKAALAAGHEKPMASGFRVARLSRHGGAFRWEMGSACSYNLGG